MIEIWIIFCEWLYNNSKTLATCFVAEVGTGVTDGIASVDNLPAQIIQIITHLTILFVTIYRLVKRPKEVPAVDDEEGR